MLNGPNSSHSKQNTSLLGDSQFIIGTIFLIATFLSSIPLFAQPDANDVWQCNPGVENNGTLSFVTPPDIPNPQFPSSAIKLAVKGWMGELDPSLQLNEISIPGTHDSGAEAKTNVTAPSIIPAAYLIYSHTQEWSILGQLDAGIRYFDIRVREENGDKVWHIYHGKVDYNLTFDQVLADMNTFLDRTENEKEVVVIRIQTAEPGVNPNYGTTMEIYKAANPKIYQDINSAVIPTLNNFYPGGIHAGKRIYMIDSHNDAINAKMHSSNYYDIIPLPGDQVIDNNTVTIEAKLRISKELIDAVPSEVAQGFWFNTPISGNGTSYVLQVPQGLTPFGVAELTNQEVFHHLESKPSNTNVGLITMDFPGEGLIYRIIQQNFVHSKYLDGPGCSFVWYQDEDEDGYGSAEITTSTNNPPGEHESANNDDCDDDEEDIHPGAVDVAGSGEDANCDGLYIWYKDNDLDGYGTSSVTLSSNSSPESGESANDEDCDDTKPAINPGASDVAGSGVDANCDGVYLWYVDSDGDGYGSSSIAASTSSTKGANQSATNDDCDDGTSLISPEGTDVVASGVDANCDGYYLWYVDGDDDGYGSAATISSPNLSPGTGESETSNDCDDANPLANPGATDVAGSGADNNCDGTYLWYVDADGDGYGSSSTVATVSNTPGTNESDTADDCDDSNANYNPAATDNVATGEDRNCDGIYIWYLDADYDGYGTLSNTTSSNSSPGTGESISSDDCDDSDPDRNPGGADVAGSGEDINCDNVYIWYEDLDGDGYGTTTTVSSTNTSPGAGESATADDCNDEDAKVNIAATDVVASGLDTNCDGLFLWYSDNDKDGYGSSTIVSSSNSNPAAGESDTSGDCDDGNAAINPDTTDFPGSGIDANCDDQYTWYIDADGDGFGSSVIVLSSNRSAGANESANAEDCNDSDANIYPGTIWYADTDGDNYGDVNSFLFQCAQPANYVLNSEDCNDSNAAIFPGASGTQEGLDNNCNGVVEEAEDVIQGISEAEKAKFSLYPNPARAYVTLSWHSQEPIREIAIIDMSGRRKIFDYAYKGSHTWSLDLTQLRSGTYILSVQYSESKVVNRSFVKR